MGAYHRARHWLRRISCSGGPCRRPMSGSVSIIYAHSNAHRKRKPNIFTDCRFPASAQSPLAIFTGPRKAGSRISTTLFVRQRAAGVSALHMLRGNRRELKLHLTSHSSRGLCNMPLCQYDRFARENQSGNSSFSDLLSTVPFLRLIIGLVYYSCGAVHRCCAPSQLTMVAGTRLEICSLEFHKKSRD